MLLVSALTTGLTYRRLGAPLPQQREQQLGGQSQRQQQQGGGLLVSSICVGTSLIGGNVMQGDDAAFKMLCTAYEEYGINFYVRRKGQVLSRAPPLHLLCL